MKKITLYYLTAIIFLSTSCKKGIDLNLNFNNFNFGGGWGISFDTNVFDSAGISYIQLPSDHYYIYKDQATGTTDSVTVT